MDAIRSVPEILSDESVASSIALAAGIAYAVDHRPSRLVSDPLWTTFDGIIDGVLTYWGINVVQWFLVPKFQWIVPGFVGASAVYYMLPFGKSAAPAPAPAPVLN